MAAMARKKTVLPNDTRRTACSPYHASPSESTACDVGPRSSESLHKRLDTCDVQDAGAAGSPLAPRLPAHDPGDALDESLGVVPQHPGGHERKQELGRIECPGELRNKRRDGFKLSSHRLMDVHGRPRRACHRYAAQNKAGSAREVSARLAHLGELREHGLETSAAGEARAAPQSGGQPHHGCPQALEKPTRRWRGPGSLEGPGGGRRKS